MYKRQEQDLPPDRKSFVYTGLLDSTFGVVDLAEAFMLIEGESYSLELYGNGEALDRLRAMAEKDPRIHCHGAVPREEALACQREAYILSLIHIYCRRCFCCFGGIAGTCIS